jgi:hypothetical protein
MDLPTHGASVLPSVTVDSYNLEVEDEDGFIGDKVSKGAFWEFVNKWRAALQDLGEDRSEVSPAKSLANASLQICWRMAMPALRFWSIARLKTSLSS